MEKAEIIQRWLDGTLSEEERAAFEKSEDFASLKKISDEVASLRAPDYDVEAELSKLKNKVKSSTGRRPTKERRLRTPSMVLRLAALVLITVGLVYVFFPKGQDTFTTINSKTLSEITLPDNSVVRMNALSSISYSEDGRTIELEGEAFFDVSKGDAFEVKTKNGVVQVLGTAFNVRDREGILEVTCYSGKVKVLANNQEQMLTKGQMLTASNTSIQTGLEVKESSPSWINGNSSFESAAFIHVVKEFERQHNVKIKLDNIDSTIQFTGTFSNSDLEVALKSITLPLHLSYQITKDQIVLSKSEK